MSWRALIVGDVHLRTDENTDDTVAALDFAAQIAARHGVDAVLFGGDIYEKASTPHERALFARVLGVMDFVPIYGVRGNHDAHEDLELFNHIRGNTWVEVPAIIEAGPVDLLLVPWPDRGYLAANGYTGEAGDRAGSAALAAMLRAMVATRERPKVPLILNAHLQVLGALSSSAQPLIGKSIEAVLGDLLDLGVTAAFYSHVHRPQELAPGHYIPGSIVCHDHGEEGEEKRIELCTVGDDGVAAVEWIPVPCRSWVTIEAFVGQEGTDYAAGEVYESIAGELMDGWHPSQIEVRIVGANLRYRYRCTEEEQHLFDHAQIVRRFAAAHTLKIVPQVERAERVRAAEVAAARSPEEKLRAWADATGAEISESHVEKLDTLESEAGA